jgi:serine/threonine protein kinase
MNLRLEKGAEPVQGYTLIERLGKGGFGQVWRASAPGGFEVALKFVTLAERVGEVELHALEVIRNIRHPNLISLHGSWERDDYLVVAMEKADRTLEDRFKEARAAGLPGIPAPEVFELFMDAAKGLDFLNDYRAEIAGKTTQGIQHRDVKPQNLLIVGGSVKVADFGLAKILELSSASHTGHMSVTYAAPEFFDGKTTRYSDQYSLAAAYYHVRGGRPPFLGNQNEVIAGHVMRQPDLSVLPEEERPAVARALSKDPGQRWPSCRAFVEALRPGLTPAGSGPVKVKLEFKKDAEPVAGYKLIEPLGEGGFGQVWKASAPGGFEVALKFVPLMEGVGEVERGSLDVIRNIRHPHLLSMFGSWEVDEYLVVAMEKADRTLLARFKEARAAGLQGIPEPEIHELFLDAAKGLDFLNEYRTEVAGKTTQGIQHRDVKPQNLLIVGGSVKVADFGLAKILEHSQTSHTGRHTVAYAAPEFFESTATRHSDQYCLAVTYCHLRGGRLPFSGSEKEILAGHCLREPDLSMLPEAERPIVARALSKDPGARWPSCRAFVDELRSSLVTKPIPGETNAGPPKNQFSAATRLLPAAANLGPSPPPPVQDVPRDTARRSTASAPGKTAPPRREDALTNAEARRRADESRKWTDLFESALTDDTGSITPDEGGSSYSGSSRGSGAGTGTGTHRTAPKPAYEQPIEAVPVQPATPSYLPPATIVTCVCGNQFEIAPEYAGLTMQCPVCGSILSGSGVDSGDVNASGRTSTIGMLLAIGGIALGALSVLGLLIFLASRR